MMRTYYTLVEREEPGTPWFIQFGDYDRETVEAERDEFRDKGFRAKNLKIVTTFSARQSVIDAAVAKLNAGE